MEKLYFMYQPHSVVLKNKQHFFDKQHQVFFFEFIFNFFNIDSPRNLTKKRKKIKNEEEDNSYLESSYFFNIIIHIFLSFWMC